MQYGFVNYQVISWISIKNGLSRSLTEKRKMEIGAGILKMNRLNYKDQDAVEFFIRLMQDLPELLKVYDIWQIHFGLEYLFNGSMSNFMYSLRDGGAPLERRIEAIQSIKMIYRHVFEPMCEPKLGHLSEEGNQLNTFCYMLWDATPLNYCERNPNKEEIYQACIEVMEAALQSNNLACVESGLHGLGHTTPYYPKCSEIINNFLKSGKCTDKHVLSYAKSALIDCIR